MIRYVLVVGLYRQDQRLYSCMKVMLSYSINTELSQLTLVVVFFFLINL